MRDSSGSYVRNLYIITKNTEANAVNRAHIAFPINWPTTILYVNIWDNTICKSSSRIVTTSFRETVTVGISIRSSGNLLANYNY